MSTAGGQNEVDISASKKKKTKYKKKIEELKSEIRKLTEYITSLQEINSPDKTCKKRKRQNQSNSQQSHRLLPLPSSSDISVSSESSNYPEEETDIDEQMDHSYIPSKHTNTDLKIVDQPTITKVITQFKHIVKIRGVNQLKFSHPKKLNDEIVRNKGTVSIDKAFFNTHNNFLYLFTNDDNSHETLSNNWLPNAFENENGVEVVKTEPKKHFIAIYNFDTTIDIDKDEYIKSIFLENGILNAKRIIKKKENRVIPVVRAEIFNTETFNKLIKYGLRISPLNYRVEEWKFEDSPIQCFNCLEFGHQKKNCVKVLRCLICSDFNHHHTDCQNKNKLKCANCNGEHAACSKSCPKAKEALD